MRHCLNSVAKVNMMSMEKKIDEILESTKLVADRLGRLIEILEPRLKKPSGAVETFSVSGLPSLSNDSLNFSDSVSRTLSALTTIQKRGGRSTAEAVASITKRTRSTESANLTKLTASGWCTRVRIGRKVIYPLVRR